MVVCIYPRPLVPKPIIFIIYTNLSKLMNFIGPQIKAPIDSGAYITEQQTRKPNETCREFARRAYIIAWVYYNSPQYLVY